MVSPGLSTCIYGKEYLSDLEVTKCARLAEINSVNLPCPPLPVPLIARRAHHTFYIDDED